MKALVTLLTLGAAGAFGAANAQAQCSLPLVMPMVYAMHHGDHHCCCATDSSAAWSLTPGRLGGYLGLMGLADRAGTPYGGMEMDAYYYLLPRLSMGLRGSFTGTSRPAGSPEAYAEAGDARVSLASISWNNRVLLSDQARWRVALEAGAGLGFVSLYDEDQQVTSNNSRNCGCDDNTYAKRLNTTTGFITEAGVAVTYKLKGDAPWLTLRAGRRQWTGGVPFGAPQQFSSYVVGLGVTLPDAPARRR